MTFLKALFVLLLAFAPASAAAETYLLMAEEDGCYWCAKWDEEIAHIYPKTAEGKTAPLKRYDLYSEKPEVTFDKKVRFTPTFILVQNGVEVGRIEGYPGEDFFWSLLSMMFSKANIPLEQTG
ncbi:hypothetical protein [uncultured Roseibium sp.]|uniref:hypothetical protein n=1 Tax=uncultured Roseibium sp. TaxID=1936171 RepID=UPI002634F37A|nr:hypothetical protein [uncultured Roseibium sp.]